MNWFVQHGKRIIRISAGVLLLAVGIFLMLPGVPGPGFVLVFIGLGILAADFVWARRLKERLETEAKNVVKKVRRQT